MCLPSKATLEIMKQQETKDKNKSEANLTEESGEEAVILRRLSLQLLIYGP